MIIEDHKGPHDLFPVHRRYSLQMLLFQVQKLLFQVQMADLFISLRSGGALSYAATTNMAAAALRTKSLTP